MIYYLYELYGDSIKIGYTSPHQLINRMSNLSTGSSQELRVVALHSGNQDKEKNIHTLLSQHHKRGEWFYLDNQVAEYIDHHADFEYAYDVFEEEIKRKKMSGNIFNRITQMYLFERAKVVVPYYPNLEQWIDYEQKRFYQDKNSLDNTPFHQEKKQDRKNILESASEIFEDTPPYVWDTH